jgi:hypothetical protein
VKITVRSESRIVMRLPEVVMLSYVMQTILYLVLNGKTDLLLHSIMEASSGDS